MGGTVRPTWSPKFCCDPPPTSPGIQDPSKAPPIRIRAPQPHFRPPLSSPHPAHLSASSMGSRLSSAVSLGSLNHDLMGMALSVGHKRGREGLGGEEGGPV